MDSVNCVLVIVALAENNAKHESGYTGADMNNIAAGKVESADTVKSEKSAVCPYHVGERIIND